MRRQPARATADGRRRIARSVVVAALLGVTACAEPVSPLTEHLPQLSLGTFASEARSARTMDERQAMLSDALPGYGGHFQQDGTTYVWVKEARSGVEDVRAGIGEFRFAGTRGPAEQIEGRRQVEESVVILDADFTFRELYEWYGQMRQGIWRVGSTGWTDIDERINRIEVGLVDIEDEAEVEGLLETLGIPRGAVVIVETNGEYTSDASLQAAVSPRMGGVEIEPGNGACSLGFSVDRSSDSYYYFVTNSHCTTGYSALDGDDVYQPTSTKIGVEVSDPSGVTSAADTLCPSGKTCRYADVALIKYTTWDFVHGYVAWPNLGNTTFSTSQPMQYGMEPEVGNNLSLVGRTTGRSAGEVLDTCVSRPGPYAGYHFLCAFTADYDSGGGDSGGSVVYIGDGFYAAAGIHQGHLGDTAVFSATTAWMDEIEDDYGQEYCVSVFCAPDPVVTIDDGPSVVPSTWVYCEWNASATRGIPPYTYTWTGVASGSGSQLNGPVSGAGYLYVEVEDAIGNSDTAWLYITIDAGADPPSCAEQQ